MSVILVIATAVGWYLYTTFVASTVGQPRLGVVSAELSTSNGELRLVFDQPRPCGCEVVYGGSRRKSRHAVVRNPKRPRGGSRRHSDRRSSRLHRYGGRGGGAGHHGDRQGGIKRRPELPVHRVGQAVAGKHESAGLRPNVVRSNANYFVYIATADLLKTAREGQLNQRGHSVAPRRKGEE